MKKARRKKVLPRKKPGRKKTTGTGVPVVVRMHKPQIKQLDQWIGETGLSRPEAVRQIVQWGLEQATQPAHPAADPI